MASRRTARGAAALCSKFGSVKKRRSWKGGGSHALSNEAGCPGGLLLQTCCRVQSWKEVPSKCARVASVFGGMRSSW